jgi:excisionase family DNA binding protein
MNASVVAGAVPANRDQMPMNTLLAYSIAQACEVANIGRTSIYEAISSRELIARKHGRRTVILADDLRRWLQNLPVTSPHSASKSQTLADRLSDNSASA